jgi:hypothetical protein
MENGIAPAHEYDFLKEEDVEKYFADLNISLLSGRHIDNRSYMLFSVLEKYEDQWSNYFCNLYQLSLVHTIFDGEVFYYLDFFSSGKAKFADSSRHKALTEMQTITALTLLDMYYQKYFEKEKIITWADLRRQIEESDHKENYQRILFNNIRPSYSESEWQNAEKKFRDAINSFDKLGWVVKQSAQGEELVFEIRPSIHRIASLYEAELADFNNFSLQLKATDTL